MTSTTRLALVFFIVFLLHAVSAREYSQEEVQQPGEESLSDSIERYPTAEGMRVRRSLATSYCQDDRILTSRIDCGWPGIPAGNCTQLNCCYDATRPSPQCYIKYGGEVTTQRSCDFRNPFSRRDCGFPEITKGGCEERGCCYDNRVWGGVVHCFHNTNNTVRSTSSPPKVSTTAESLSSTTESIPSTTAAVSAVDMSANAITKSDLELLMIKMDNVVKTMDALKQQCTIIW